jgi:RNA polymerase sigma factor (sigma-70 family)
MYPLINERAKLQHKYGSDDERIKRCLARRHKISKKLVTEALELGALRDVSVDKPLGQGFEDLTILDRLATPDDGPEVIVTEKELHQAKMSRADRMLSKLDPVDRKVIEMRYLGRSVLSYREIGAKLGVSHSRAQQRAARAQRKLDRLQMGA